MVWFSLRLDATDNENRQLPLRTRLQHLDALRTVTLIAATCCLLLASQWGNISLKAVFNIGATNLAALTTDLTILRAMRGSYSRAVISVLYFVLRIVVFALPFPLALKWKNVKKVSAQRIQEQKDKGGQSEGEGSGGVLLRIA